MTAPILEEAEPELRAYFTVIATFIVQSHAFAAKYADGQGIFFSAHLTLIDPTQI